MTNPRNLVLFDIDGCLLEPDPERLEAAKVQDWARYHGRAHLDAVIPAGLAVYKALVNDPNLRCVFLTDRSERNRAYTQRKLDELGFSSVPLLMRDAKRKRMPKDGGFSKLLTLAASGFSVLEIMLVFEDRQEIVDLWRNLHVTVYQTKVADYPI